MTVPLLSEAEQGDLRRLVVLMIPASEEFGVPGADDPTIFASIVESLKRDTAEARSVLRRLAGPDWDKAVAALREEGGNDLMILHRVVLLCYYRDDRVMIALGMEPRPPFPKGHVLEDGDWGLLEPVRARKKIWRDAT